MSLRLNFVVSNQNDSLEVEKPFRFLFTLKLSSTGAADLSAIVIQDLSRWLKEDAQFELIDHPRASVQ